MSNIKEELINTVVLKMSGCLNDEQLYLLKDTLYISLNHYNVENKANEIATSADNNDYWVMQYLAGKVSSNTLSEKTTKLYSYRLKNFFNTVNKSVQDIDADDIRMYFVMIRKNADGSLKKNNSMSTIYNILNSFFSWLFDNEFITKNPMAKVDNFKIKRTIKKPYTEEELASIKDACTDLRDMAIIDLLDSSMIRVGELCRLNRDDISFTKKEFIVLGKGDKERVAYFDGETSVHLQQYLESRTDNNPALFVSKHGESPRRLKEHGVQSLCQALGEQAGISDVHPHRFRRTGATRCLRAGMPLEVIQHLLGHSNITTTQIYAQTNESTVKHYYSQVYND